MVENRETKFVVQVEMSSGDDDDSSKLETQLGMTDDGSSLCKCRDGTVEFGKPNLHLLLGLGLKFKQDLG